MFPWLAVNLLLLLASYLLGSLPTGYLLGRWLKGIDIREYGSGSTGATNVLRTLGKGPGLLVLLIDAAKGALAIVLCRWSYGHWGTSWLALPTQIADAAHVSIAQLLPWIAVSCGLAAILGHSKSVWLGFSGGKSVATGLGVLLALDWRMGLAALGVFVLVLALTRWVSLSSISGAVALPIVILGLKLPLPYLLLALLGGGYVIWRHQSNIQRLLAGTEPRLGTKSEAVEPLETPKGI